MDRAASLAVAFAGGVVLTLIGMAGAWIVGVSGMSFPSLIAAILVYFKEREEHPLWANFLGAGIAIGLITVFALMACHLAPATARR